MPQLIQNVLPIRTDVDIGIGRVQGNSLIRIEVKRPCAGPVLNAVEGADASDGRKPGLGVESERYVTGSLRRAQWFPEERFSRFVKRISAPRIAEHIPKHRPPPTRTEQF